MVIACKSKETGLCVHAVKTRCPTASVFDHDDHGRLLKCNKFESSVYGPTEGTIEEPPPGPVKQGTKYDSDKLRWDLLPLDALEQVVKIYTVGVGKYGERNWEVGIKYSRIIGAIFRHFTAWCMGQNTDSETGLSHLAHATWGLFALMWYQQHKPEMDDRR